MRGLNLYFVRVAVTDNQNYFMTIIVVVHIVLADNNKWE